MSVHDFAKRKGGPVMRWMLSLLLVLSAAGTVRAGWLNAWGRSLGIGWSDGYHAFDQCPPRGAKCFAIPPGGFIPADPAAAPQPTPAQPRENSLPVPRTTARRPSQSAAPHPVIELPR